MFSATNDFLFISIHPSTWVYDAICKVRLLYMHELGVHVAVSLYSRQAKY